MGTLIKIAENDNDRCTHATEKGRRCLLVTHPDTQKHVMVNRKPAETQPKLADVLPKGFSLKATEVKTGEVLKKDTGRKPMPRDADQKKVDEAAKLSYDANTTAGKHAGMDFDQYKLSQYIVPPQAVEVVLDYLRKCRNNGGSVPTKAVFRYKKGNHSSGNVRIQWAYLNPKPADKPANAS